jgi:hypothetical protein
MMTYGQLESIGPTEGDWMLLIADADRAIADSGHSRDSYVRGASQKSSFTSRVCDLYQYITEIN